MDSDKLLNDLLSEEKETVVEALDSIKKSMSENNGSLMIGNIKKLYRGFYNIMACHSFEPVHECTNILIDILK